MTSLSSTSKDDIGRKPWRSDGRLIVSYPKSGRTWLRFALSEASIDATFTHAGASTNRREIGRPYEAIPARLKDHKVVFLYRNPLDTAVSIYYQVTRRDLRRGTGRWLRMWLPLVLKGALPPRDIDAFVLHPVHGIAKVCAYNRLWLDHLVNRPDCLVLTYEQMRADPVSGFQRLLDHWGESGRSGRDLAEASSFDKMRKVEQTSKANQTLLKPNPSGDTAGAKVRKGKVKGYLDELRPETVETCREIAARYGFEI